MTQSARYKTLFTRVITGGKQQQDMLEGLGSKRVLENWSSILLIRASSKSHSMTLSSNKT